MPCPISSDNIIDWYSAIYQRSYRSSNTLPPIIVGVFVQDSSHTEMCWSQCAFVYLPRKAILEPNHCVHWPVQWPKINTDCGYLKQFLHPILVYFWPDVRIESARSNRSSYVIWLSVPGALCSPTKVKTTTATVTPIRIFSSRIWEAIRRVLKFQGVGRKVITFWEYVS